MAVDVPDSFIARNKTPPRYPPPHSAQTQVIYAPNGAMPQVAKSLLSSSTSSSTNGGGVSLELQPLDTFGHTTKGSPSIDSCTEFSKKSSSKGPSSLGSTCESIGFDSMSYRTKSRGSLSTRSSSSGDLGPPEYDLGPHRELPVDVPDNFVAVAKAPPRYPPPKIHNAKEMVKSKESLSSNGSIEKQLPQPQAPVRNNEVFVLFSFHFCFYHFYYLLIFWCILLVILFQFISFYCFFLFLFISFSFLFSFLFVFIYFFGCGFYHFISTFYFYNYFIIIYWKLNGLVSFLSHSNNNCIEISIIQCWVHRL